MIKLVAAIVLMVASAVCHSAEVTLFDVPLRTAGRNDIRAAILQAGGTEISSTRDVETYNARKIGLPGAINLEVIYLNDRFVMAQYALNVHYNDEEQFRKMLVSKYGQPGRSTNAMDRGRRFDAQYISDGKYFWQFEGQMEIVFNKPWDSTENPTLSYVSRVEQAKLNKLVEEKARRMAEKAATKNRRAF